jgi:transposase
MTALGETLCDNFTFPNSQEGFDAFLQLVNTYSEKGAKVKVGLEATGHYSTNLLSFLERQPFEVVVLNPLLVNRQKTATSLRRTKTDKNDARYIARVLQTSKAQPYQEPLYHASELKSLSRARSRLAGTIQPLKNRYRRLLDILFPEISSVFRDLYCATALALLEKLPGAKAIAACSIGKLTKLLSTASHGRFKEEKAGELKQIAQNSIAAGNEGDAFELKLTVQQIVFLERQKAELEAKIHVIMLEVDSPIMTIPGIGETLGAAILGEIGDIHTFPTPAKLQAFAGCEPSTYQSGKYTASGAKMVKHGSKYLRNALYLAVRFACLHSRTFREYVQRKQGEGKHYFVAMSHGMKKMTRVIFAVLTKNTPFVESI